MKTFSMKHRFFKDLEPRLFDEETAPDWLTSKNSIPGSTMDGRWFWNEHVLTLEVNESINTDFQTITRVS